MAESKLEQKPENSQRQMEQATPKLTLAEFLAQQQALQHGRLAANANGIEVALEEQGAAIIQTQQNQVNATTVAGWTAVLATIISTSNLEHEQEQRRALKAVQEQMFELIAKEKEKAKFREASFFTPLVGLLGHSTVESITQKLEAAASGGLQASQAARAQVASDLVAILQRGSPNSKTSISGHQVAIMLERELAQAVAVLPTARPTFQVVRPEDSLALKAHESMRALSTGQERLLEIQKLRESLGPEKFSAMVDAYDKKFGIPFVVHVATISSLSPSTQTELMHEMTSVLSQAQQQRCTEYGRAEFAQVMAVLDRQRESAELQTKVIYAQMRDTEKHLTDALGRPELKDLPVNEIRAKVVSEIVSRFPGLKGKTFEEIALRLKEVAGEKDKATAEKLLRLLTKDSGGSSHVDLGAAHELATRTTIHMQKLLVLDQQLEAANKRMSKAETGDEAILRNHYAKVYGVEATTNSPQFAELKSAAGSYMRNLEQRIADPSLSTQDREELIRERDTIDFGYTKKLVAEALSRETPDPQRALAVLAAFYGTHADTEYRRGAQVLETARSLTEAIQNADALRREWQGLTPDQFTDLKLQKQTGTELMSLISARTSKALELNLTKRFAELKAGGGSKVQGDGKTLLAALGTNNQPVTRRGQLDVLAAQREAAQSTKWFSQIIETGAPLEKGEAPIVKVAETKESIAMETRMGRLNAARSGMDIANVRARTGLSSIESEPSNAFVRAENLTAIERSLKSEVAKKLGAASGVEAVAKISRELDPQKELLVDKEVLANLRRVADPNSEIGKAILASPALPSDPQTEYQAIKSRLSLENAVRFDTFIAVEEHLLASGGKSDAAGIFQVVTEAPIELLSGKLKESLNEARISRVERLLGVLTDEEHQEFLAFFELTTRQSIGQALIQGVPVSDNRGETLVRLAESRNLTAADVRRLLSEPIPADRKARAEALARALESDSKRPPIDTQLVEGVARSYGFEYATLRAAANVAAEQGKPDLVAEIAEKMRAHESRVNGTISRTVSAVDPTYLARQGVREALKSATEEEYDTHSKRVYSNSAVVARTAREAVALLRPEEPKNDAAFNRIRQANLSEEESLYLRALYAQEAGKASLGEGFRTLSSNLATDLEPVGQVLEAEKTRIACLTKGGKDTLFQADLLTLHRASIEHHEKRQLETLINLRASGRYEQAKGEIEKLTLAPAADEYHKAVSSGDTVKADTEDITSKAKNGNLRPEDVPAFLKDKTSEDFARINKENPELRQLIQTSNPILFFNTDAAKLLSENEADRKKAVEQMMLKSLTDPMLFNEWLNVAKTKEAKVELIRNLEALIEKQPNAPKFVANDEPKIVQYIRAQQTDFREIDAHLINTIIVSSLSTGQPLKAEVVERLRTLRAEATAQLTTLDVFHDARNAILTGAKDVQKGLESYQVWANGSAELKKIEVGSFEWLTNGEGKQQKEEARAKILADLRERHPELKNRTDTQIEHGEFGTRYHWRSGYILDKPIALTANRLAAQQRLIAPMEGGVRDIRQSRELVRAGFALMAKDAVAEVHRGLSPDATENVMTLLRQRDQKITYKVTDEKAHKEWSDLVEKAQTELDAKDRWTNYGLASAKIGTCLVASVFFTPAVGLGVATFWNVGDKAYRRYQLGEDWSTLGKAFAFEAVIDVVSFKLAFKANTVTFVGGEAAKQTGTQGVKVTKVVIEGVWKRFSRDSVSRLLRNPLIVHSERLASESAPKFIKEGVATYAEKAAAKAAENAIKKAAEVGIKDAGDLARVGVEAVEEMSKWVMVSAKQRGLYIPLPLPKEDSAQRAPKPPVVTPEDAAKEKLVRDEAVSVGVPPPKMADTEDLFVVPNNKPESPPAAVPLVVSPVTSPAGTPVTFEELLAAHAQLDPPQELALKEESVRVNEPQKAPVAESAPPDRTDQNLSLHQQPAATKEEEPLVSKLPGDSGAVPPSPPSSPTSPPSGGMPPGDTPPGDAPGSGPRGDAPGRGIAVTPDQPTAQGNPHAANSSAAQNEAASPVAQGGSESVGNATSIGASATSAHAGVQPGLQPIADTVGNPHANIAPNSIEERSAIPSPIISANGLPQGMQAHNSLPQPAAIEPLSDTVLTGVSRASVQTAVMNDALKQNELVAHKVAAAEEPHRIPNPQREVANKKTLADDEIVLMVHKREPVAMKEFIAGHKTAVAEGESRVSERGAVGKDQAANAGAAKSDEMVRDVARMRDIHEAKRAEAVALTETREREVAKITEPVREVQREHGGAQTKAVETSELATKTVAVAHDNSTRVIHTTSASPQSEAPVAEQPRSHPEVQSAFRSPKQEEQSSAATTRAVLESRTVATQIVSQPSEQESSTTAQAGSQSGMKFSEAAETKTAERSSAAHASASALTATWHAVAQPPAMAVSGSGGASNGDTRSGTGSGDGGGAPAPKRAHKPRTAQDDARMRNLILQQLMLQHTTTAQREKLLKALLALGISEAEYRALVSKLGEIDATRLAQQQADRMKFAEPVAIANEVPENKNGVEPPKKEIQPPPAPKSQTTRAQLYQRLKEEATATRKRPE